jgi:hypothetical protein
MDPCPSPAEIYEKDGAVPLGPVLEPDPLAEVQQIFDDILAHGFTGPYASIVHDPWRRSTRLRELIPMLGEKMCRALGIPELVLFHDHFLHKPPGGENMGWHQDFSYLPVDREDGLTLWIAITDVTEENGCLYYLYGTHRLGERRAGWGIHSDADPRASLPPIDVDPSEPGVAVPAKAGHGLAHHGCLWHRSPRNRSDKPRRSWALSFVTPATRWSPSHSPHPRSAMEPRSEGQAMESDLIRVGA